MAQIKFQWQCVGNTVMVLPDPQKADGSLRDSATRGIRSTVMRGAIDLAGQSVGMRGEAELQLNINVLYRVYLVQ